MSARGDHLLIYMKDGSVIRCNNYFVEDTETHNHSELVFNDNQELTHISFADAGEASGVAATELTAQAAPISSIEPFLEQGSVWPRCAVGLDCRCRVRGRCDRRTAGSRRRWRNQNQGY
ncbi:BapA/Bap/LapF family prefix-like domain-containing protein [Enterobacter hormaechei]